MLVVLLALVGCSGGEDADSDESADESSEESSGESAEESESLDEDELAEAVDQVCIDFNSGIQDLPIVDEFSDVGLVIQFADGYVQIMEDVRESLEDLSPPSDRQDDIDEMVELAQDVVETYGAFADALRSGDNDEVLAVESEVQDALEAFREVDEIAADFGADIC